MKTNTRGPNQGTIANALVPILVVRLKFNRADELDKLWIEVEDVEEAVGENLKEEMGLDRKWLYYFTRAWAAAIKMGLSLHERAAAIISPTTWYFVPGLPRLSNVVTINPKKQKTTQEKAYLLIRYVLFHCLFYLCILYFQSLLHLDLKCYSLEGGRKME